MAGVKPHAGADTLASLRAGHRVTLDQVPQTVADGPGHTIPSELPWQVNAMLLDDVVTVITSVHKEIRNRDQPPPGRGGHLVYVTGYAYGALNLRNPSGHTALARKAVVPVELFALTGSPGTLRAART